MKKIHFEGLNELRAIAAFSVIIYHLELYKNRDKITGLFNTIARPIVESIGHDGVNLFFVLSGFLITYLLIEEKEKNNKIEIKKFYIRRILRIWPLYYFIFLLSLLFLPFLVNNFEIFSHEIYYYNTILKVEKRFISLLFLFVLFIPNLALVLNMILPGASQAWSVGVEEQYYLFWPVVIDKIKKTNWVKFFIIFIVIKLIIDTTLLLTIPKNSISLFMKTFKVELMALGAIGAFYNYYHNEKLFSFINNKKLILFNYVAILLCLIYKAHHIIIGISFIILILGTVNNVPFSLRNKFLEKMGKISYGIYMYHPILMFIVFTFTNQFIAKTNTFLYNVVLYSLTFGITILVSQLSYKYLESYFLTLKSKGYTVIESGS